MSKATQRFQARDVVGTAFGFGAVLTALVIMDPRVSHKLSSAFYPSPSEKLLSWGERAGELLGTVLVATREQASQNGGLLAMTVVAILLVGFMVKE